MILNESAVSKKLRKACKHFSEDKELWKPLNNSDDSSKADADATPIKKEKKDRDTHDGNKKMAAYTTPTTTNLVKYKRAVGRVKTLIHLPNFFPSTCATRTIVTPTNKCMHCGKATNSCHEKLFSPYVYSHVSVWMNKQDPSQLDIFKIKNVYKDTYYSSYNY